MNNPEANQAGSAAKKLVHVLLYTAAFVENINVGNAVADKIATTCTRNTMPQRNNTMHMVCCLLLVMIVQAALPHAHAANIGYGSSDAVYSAKNQEYFFLGFTLGLEVTLAPPYKHMAKELVTPLFLNDQRSLSPVRAAKGLLAKNVAALVGFPTSHEALLVADLAKNGETTFISAAAAHSKMANFGPYIYTLGESGEASQKMLVEFLFSKLQGKKGLMAVDSGKVFSKDQADAVMRALQSKQAEELVDQVSTDSNGRFSPEILAKFADHTYSYIILTTYADDSIKLLEQLATTHLRVPIIANSSWIIGNIELVYRLLLSYPGPVYCVSSVVKGLPSAQAFEAEYKRLYGKVPESEMYYGYDLGVVIGQTVNRIKGAINKTSFSSAFREDRCFSGTTTGRLCFPINGGHAERKIYWLRFSGIKGFVPDQS